MSGANEERGQQADPQLADLRALTGLEGDALDTLAGRLVLLKQIKSGDLTGVRPGGTLRSGKRGKR
jgi:hypothetical protein